MLLTIQEQFENLFTPDDIELYMEIGQSLQDLGYTVLGASITDIIASGVSEQSKQLEIKELHNETLVYILSTYGVKIKPDVDNLVTLFSLVRLIKRIEENENSEDIVGLCQTDEDPIETVVLLSTYLGEMEWTDILSNVEEVSPLFIERIVTHHDESDEINEDSIVAHYVERTQSLMDSLESDELPEYVAFYSDKRNYGYDFEALMAMRFESILTYRDTTLVKALKLTALGSNLPDDKIYEVCDRWINQYVDKGMRVYNLTSLL